MFTQVVLLPKHAAACGHRAKYGPNATPVKHRPLIARTATAIVATLETHGALLPILKIVMAGL